MVLVLVASISAVDLREPGSLQHSAGGSLTGLLQWKSRSQTRPDQASRVHVYLLGSTQVRYRYLCAHSYQPRSHAVLTSSSSAIRMHHQSYFSRSRFASVRIRRCQRVEREYRYLDGTVPV